MLNTADVCVNPDVANDMNDKSTMNKIMEYMAMSRPIVSFELREARVSAGDAAVYAPANDESEFAKLTAYLLDSPEDRQRMGEIGRARVAGPLSWDQSKISLLAAYEAAVEGLTVPRPRWHPTADIETPRRPAAPAAQDRPAPVEEQDGQVAAGIQRAYFASRNQREQGSGTESALDGGSAQLGELPVTGPDTNPSAQIRGDGPGRAHE